MFDRSTLKENESDLDSLCSDSHCQGEICYRIIDSSLLWDKDHHAFKWLNIPRLYLRHVRSLERECHPINDSTTTSGKTCSCIDNTISSHESQAKFRLLVGDWRLGLYVQNNDSYQFPSYQQTAARVQAGKAASASVGMQNFANTKINAQLLSYYLCSVIRGDDVNFDADDIARRNFRKQLLSRNAPGMSLVSVFHSFPTELCQSFHALEIASKVYDNLKDATISLKLLSTPLFEGTWLPSPLVKEQFLSVSDPITSILEPVKPVSINRQQAFACVTKFETGFYDLDLDDLETTFAVCSEDSIYVAAVVLSDPSEYRAPYDLRRIVGNIGHPGISLLVAPEQPKIRKLTDQYNAVAHAPYDFKRENNFAGTTLHLSFTDWKFPLEAGGTRTIDQDVLVVESVISLLDRGKWVADLDILSIDFESLYRIVKDCPQSHHTEDSEKDYDYTSIDNWEEFLDKPESVGVFRAYGNWAARLAAVSLLAQQGQQHSIAVFEKARACFRCLEAEAHDTSRCLGADWEGLDMDLAEYESNLPSFLVD